MSNIRIPPGVQIVADEQLASVQAIGARDAGSSYAIIGRYGVGTNVDPAESIVVQSLYYDYELVGEIRRVKIEFDNLRNCGIENLFTGFWDYRES